jgi:cytochrome d ubiquinol oxidase subunit I
MGLLWPHSTATFGSVFGLGFAIEGFSFFTKAIFLPVTVTELGIGLLNVASAPWAHAIGVLALAAAAIGGVAAIVPRALADPGGSE